MSSSLLRLLGGCLVGALLTLGPVADRADAAPGDDRPLVDEASEQAAADGIDWLLDAQRADGSWGCLPGEGQTPSTSVTSLAGLTLMASGSAPGRGEYADPLEDALYWILEVAEQNRGTGQIAVTDVVGLGPMYDHAMATTFLAELSGMSNYGVENERIRAALDGAVSFIARRQNPDGGWGGGGRSELPLTAQMWLALRCARNAGVKIPADVSAEEVEAFVERCSVPTGGYAYYETGQGGAYGYQHNFWSTSAGLRIMYGLGRDTDEVRRGAEELANMNLGVDYGGRVSEWDFAGIFLAGQALLIEDGPFWESWFPRIRDQLVGIQNADGSWSIQYCAQCRAYATSMAVLTLLTPHRLLPMFQL